MVSPFLFRYSGDQEDKEWLAKNQLMSTTGGKAYLMVLTDILELARSPDYSAHPRQQPSELVGFTVPSFMMSKMRRFVSVMRTPRAVPDADLISHGERQVALWEKERRSLIGARDGGSGREEKPTVVPAVNSATLMQDVLGDKVKPKVDEEEEEEGEEEEEEEQKKKQVQEILEEIKTETAAVEERDSGGEEELGFLNGMNLSSLVREFEMEAAAGRGVGSRHRLDILSLADDDDEEEREEAEEKGGGDGDRRPDESNGASSVFVGLPEDKGDHGGKSEGGTAAQQDGHESRANEGDVGKVVDSSKNFEGNCCRSPS